MYKVTVAQFTMVHVRNVFSLRWWADKIEHKFNGESRQFVVISRIRHWCQSQQSYCFIDEWWFYDRKVSVWLDGKSGWTWSLGLGLLFLKFVFCPSRNSLKAKTPRTESTGEQRRGDVLNTSTVSNSPTHGSICTVIFSIWPISTDAQVHLHLSIFGLFRLSLQLDSCGIQNALHPVETAWP